MQYHTIQCNYMQTYAIKQLIFFVENFENVDIFGHFDNFGIFFEIWTIFGHFDNSIF